MASMKQVELIEALQEATLKGALAWSVTKKNGRLVASVGGNTVELYTVPSDEADPQYDPDLMDYVVRIVNEAGEPVDFFTDVNLMDEFTDYYKTSEKRPFRILKSVHEAALRQVSGADKVLETIISNLRRKSP